MLAPRNYPISVNPESNQTFPSRPGGTSWLKWSPSRTMLLLNTWKRLLATVIEAGANASGAGIISGMWMGSEGIIIKGPFGLYIAAGYACYDIEGSTGVACGLSVGTSMVAYDQVFLIS
ncbi:hypothetical protein NXS19_004662 [Fusarium pseudograminearum]|nr:hypothetical protein NXS19_004662 [Fusarium pseudograminearum]